MAMKITKDGVVTSAPGPSSYIGKDADNSVKRISKDWSYKKVCDCIGCCGYRNITMVKMETRLEIICETDNREEIVKESIAPHEAKWIILDIFKYRNRPTEGKGFY
jgi:hypothetical protein